MIARTWPSRVAFADRRWDEAQFRLLFGICFVPCLIGVAASRLHRVVTGTADDATRGSILTETCSASRILAATAFDG